MGKAAELIFPAAGGTEGIKRAFTVAAAVLIGGPQAYPAAAFAAVAQIFAPTPPSPAPVASSIRQPRPPRVSGTGRARLAPAATALYEADGKFSQNVYAWLDGEITEYEQWWLHDDIVTLDDGVVQEIEPGRYKGDRVILDWRYGAATETVYGDLITAMPDFWSSTSRGDGVASTWMQVIAPAEEDFRRRFPNGLPDPKVVAKLSPVFDPRDAGQTVGDPASWAWSENPVLALLWYLCLAEGGPRLDYARHFAPVIDSWTRAADVCDELVPLKAGGDRARYRHGGTWTWDMPPSAVIAQYIECFDGWLAPDGSGHFIVRAGKYYEPTVVLESDDLVFGYQINHFRPDEEATNEITLTYRSPNHEWNDVETDPWLAAAEQAATGVRRTQDMSLPWVHHQSQARRLAKRAMSRLAAQTWGTITVDLFGKPVLGERYIRLRLGEGEPESLRDVVVQISADVEIDPDSCLVTIPWVVADPLEDSWDPATEEGDGPTPMTGAETVDLTPPTVTSIETEETVIGETTVSTVLCVTPDLSRAGLSWQVRRRATGSVEWTTYGATVTDAGATLELRPSGAFTDSIDVQFRYTDDATGLSSDWVPTTPATLVAA